MTIQWWGYLHINGTLQVKRFFDGGDLEEALESPFVQRTFGPVDANSREEAIKKLEEARKNETS